MLSHVQVRLIVGVGLLCTIACCTSDRGAVALADCPQGCWNQGPSDHIAYFTGTQPVKCVKYDDGTTNSVHCCTNTAFANAGTQKQLACRVIDADNDKVHKYQTKDPVCNASCSLAINQAQEASPSKMEYVQLSDEAHAKCDTPGY